MNYELEKIWKESVIVYIKVLSRHLPGGIEENYKNLSKDSRSVDRDLNKGLPKYEARILTTRSRRSVN
jgi:hypothetical protein